MWRRHKPLSSRPVGSERLGHIWTDQPQPRPGSGPDRTRPRIQCRSARTGSGCDAKHDRELANRPSRKEYGTNRKIHIHYGRRCKRVPVSRGHWCTCGCESKFKCENRASKRPPENHDDLVMKAAVLAFFDNFLTRSTLEVLRVPEATSSSDGWFIPFQ